MNSSTSGFQELIGLLGGSFDPIHLGHIHLAKQLLEKYQFKKLYFIPAQQNPLKEQKARANSNLRLQLLKAALREAQEPRFDIWDSELSRTGLSYTVDTLREIGEKHSCARTALVLILGNEVYADFSKWKEPQQILKIANLSIIDRVSDLSTELSSVLRELGVKASPSPGFSQRFDTEYSTWVEGVSINTLPFSSTEIRKTLFKAWNSKDLQNTPQGIQRSVWLLIKENQLYTVE